VLLVVLRLLLHYGSMHLQPVTFRPGRELSSWNGCIPVGKHCL
jgi:hypothetical protein